METTSSTTLTLPILYTQVALFKGSHIRLDPKHLKLACSYGIADKKEKAKKAVVYRIMESIYSEEYMAAHTTSGRPAPGNSKEQAKPALPVEDVEAIVGRSFESRAYARTCE